MADRATQQDSEVQGQSFPGGENFPTGVETIVRKVGLLSILILTTILVLIFWPEEEATDPAPETTTSPLELMRKSDAQLPAGFGE